MSDSDSSALSSPPPSDGENPFVTANAGGITRFFQKTRPASPRPSVTNIPKRPASPPHEYVLADNQDIPFLVMFASRFHQVLPKSLPSFGPQDLERGATEAIPGEPIENLLCAVLGLVLNRKKLVERAHYQRALEEAIQTHAIQWPKTWNGQNPLRGGKSFSGLDAPGRLTVLKNIAMWTLSSSQAVRGMLTASYKQVRREDDLNQPLSVQPWGEDGFKRKYWLIEGREDTEFRLYRESEPKLKVHLWWSVAGSIDELKRVGALLSEDGSQAARRLSERITLAIPRLEACQERRKRREYRLARKAQFSRPEPGFSMYEGRTRGKKLKYTFSSDEEEDGEPPQKKSRSSRLSGVSTPSVGSEGPVFTASGRQVRARMGGIYGELMHSGQTRATPATSVAECSASETQQPPSPGMSRRSGLRRAVAKRPSISTHTAEAEETDDEAAASSESDAYLDEDGDGQADESAGEELSEDDEDLVRPRPSLIVKLKCRKLLSAAIQAPRPVLEAVPEPIPT